MTSGRLHMHLLLLLLPPLYHAKYHGNTGFYMFYFNLLAKQRQQEALVRIQLKEGRWLTLNKQFHNVPDKRMMFLDQFGSALFSRGSVGAFKMSPSDNSVYLISKASTGLLESSNDPFWLRISFWYIFIQSIGEGICFKVNFNDKHKKAIQLKYLIPDNNLKKSFCKLKVRKSKELMRKDNYIKFVKKTFTTATLWSISYHYN